MLFYKYLLVRYILVGIVLFSSLSHSKDIESLNVVFAADMNEIGTLNGAGYPQLATFLEQQRSQTTPLFFIFGGASIGPSMLSNLDRGSHIIDLLNSLEPDVMVVTKRDFSFHEDELSMRSYEAAFPFVASNLEEIDSKQNINGIENSVVIEQGKYKLGIMSALPLAAIQEYGLKRINYIDKITAITKQATELRQQSVDLVVLVNTGIKNDVESLLENGTVDIIIQMDSNASNRNSNAFPTHPNYIFLTEPRAIGLINISWQKDHEKTLNTSLTTHKFSDIARNVKVQIQVQEYLDRLASLIDEVIGINLVSMDTYRNSVRLKENAFGNYLADLLKEYTQSDVGLINGGTIRGEKAYLPNQPLSRKDITKELPYRNQAVKVSLSGKQLKQVLEHSFSGIDDILGRFPHVSGMKVYYDSNNPKGNRVVKVEINNKPLEIDKLYTLATSNYLAEGGDGFTMLLNAKKENYSRQMNSLISEIVITDIKKRGVFSTTVEQRVTEVN